MRHNIQKSAVIAKTHKGKGRNTVSPSPQLNFIIMFPLIKDLKNFWHYLFSFRSSCTRFWIIPITSSRLLSPV